MEIIFSIVIFTVALVYIFVIDSFALTPIAILRALVLPMIVLLLILYRTSLISWRKFVAKRGKWFLLFWGTVFLQLLVLSTGGIQSPFLILIHLFMIGLSFVFSFSVSLLFLVFSFFVITGDIMRDPELVRYLIEHPHVIILQLAAVIPIVAVAYIISQQYRLKDMLSRMLGTQVKTDEAILERIKEMIIITDPQLVILSVNDAVERALQKSRSELLNKELFGTLLIKSNDGKLLNKSYFYPDGKTFDKHKNEIVDCTIVNSSMGMKKLMIQVQPIEDTDNKLSQISFIISTAHQEVNQGLALDVSIERARAKYKAILETLKNKGIPSDLANNVVLADSIEEDVFAVLELKNQTKNTTSRIDIAQLCKETVQREQEFAKKFQMPVTFELQNFGWKDIAPLTVKNYAVKPEQLTGPFFTVDCDVEKVGHLIKKILDLAVMLASSSSNGQVHLNVEPKEDAVVIRVFSNCPALLEKELEELYVPYYGTLSAKTNLQAGSGLEGYLIDATSKLLGITVERKYNANSQNSIEFVLNLKKKSVSTGADSGSQQA